MSEKTEEEEVYGAPVGDPNDCDECLAEMEESGEVYEASANWINGVWICEWCSRPV